MPDSSWTRLVRGTVVHTQTSRIQKAFVLVVVALVSWETFTVATQTYARRSKATGEVTAVQSGTEIVAPRAGVLTTPLPIAGTVVKAGEILTTMRFSELEIQGMDQPKQLLERKRQQARTAIEALAQQRNEASSSLAMQLRSLATEIESLHENLSNRKQKLALAEAKLASYTKMAKDFSQNEIDSVRLEILSERETVLRGQSEILQAEDKKRSARESHDQRMADIAHRGRLLKNELVDIDSSELDTMKQVKGSLVATSDGIVSSVLAEVGKSVAQGQTIAVIDHHGPQSDAFSIRLRIDSNSIGTVDKGAEVWVELLPFPAREFGLFKARVDSIAFINPSAANEKSFFVIEAKLENKAISQFGRQVRLKPGMAVSADVVTDRLTLLEWVLEPVLINRQFR